MRRQEQRRRPDGRKRPRRPGRRDGHPAQCPAGQGGPEHGKQKVVLLAGAALLFYLYKRYQSQDKAAAAAGGAKPQLYREDKGPNKGAIYYRKNDANHTVVWLQAPAQGVQVPADQAQQTLGNGFDPNNPNAYQPSDQINPNPQAGVNGGSVQSADQYAGASQ